MSQTDQKHILESREAMLDLFDEVFFEYSAETDVITFFHTGSSYLNEGEVSFQKLLDRFRERIDPDALPALLQLADALRERRPSFSVVVPANLLYDDESVVTTLVRGKMKRYQSGAVVTVGRIHLLWMSDTRYAQTLSYDPLTEVVGKKDISRLAKNLIDDLHAGNTTIAIVDIDYFKHVNDTYGHMFGDHVLKMISGIMKREVGERGTIGRIGGDEFFIIFHNISEKNDLREYLHNIRASVNKAFHDKGPQGDKPISLSIGTATYPDHASNYEDLFTIADYCLYLAKEKGRNRFIMYNPGKHAPLEQIREIMEHGSDSHIVFGRDDLSPGDVLSQMWFMVLYGKKPGAGALLNEFTERFHIPAAAIYRRDDRQLLLCAGEQKTDVSAAADGLFRQLSPEKYEFRSNRAGLILCNNVNSLPKEMEREIRQFTELGLYSFILIPYKDPKGTELVMAMLSLHRNLLWNEGHFMYYRLFADILQRYDADSLNK